MDKSAILHVKKEIALTITDFIFMFKHV